MAQQLQLRNGALVEWVEENPILAEGEPGVILEPSGNIVLGDGKRRYKDLPFHAWGKDAYDILVTYGGYKGSKEDFCRQLDVHLKTPEQQAGQLVNAGAGWNSFSFMKEFSEDVYVLLTPQSATVFASVRNISKQGFHYCLYDADGNTVSGNVVVNYLAVAVSELNMAQAIAKASGLNPFDFDNLTDLFASHAAEVVGNEAAFNLIKRSGMAAGRYICHLTGLNPVTYFNMVSIAGDASAMNTVAVTEEALTFIVMAPGAYDSIRLGTMPMSKYLAGLISLVPEGYSTVTNLFDDNAALTALVADRTAMHAFVGSEVACAELAVHATACSAVAGSDIAMQAVAGSDIAMQAVAGSDIAMQAVAGSDIAMQAVAGSDIAYNAIYNNSEAFATLLTVGAAVSIIANDRAAVEAMIDTEERCILVAASATAMDALAASAVARAAVKGNEKAWKVVTGTDAFIAKYAVGCLENAKYKPANFANMAAIASNSGACTALSASQIAMNALSASRIARNALLNNSVSWKVVTDSNSFIAKYAIGCLENSSYKPENFAGMSNIVSNSAALAALASSSVVIKVPKLTANDSRVLAPTSPIYSSRYGWYAFDGSVGSAHSTGFVYGSGTVVNNAYIGFYFDQAVGCMYFDLAGCKDSGSIKAPKTVKIQCSDNGSSWTDVETFSLAESYGTMNRKFLSKSQGRHRYWRILVTEGYNTSYCGISEVQFYCF